MMHFNNHKDGFSFIEVVLAIAIIGLILTSLYNLQSGIFNISFGLHSKVLRIFNIQNIFFDYKTREQLIKKEDIKKVYDDPSLELTAKMQKPNDKSALTKFDNIYVIKSTGKWQSTFRESDETLVTLLFNKQEKKK